MRVSCLRLGLLCAKIAGVLFTFGVGRSEINSTLSVTTANANLRGVKQRRVGVSGIVAYHPRVGSTWWHRVPFLVPSRYYASKAGLVYTSRTPSVPLQDHPEHTMVADNRHYHCCITKPSGFIQHRQRHSRPSPKVGVPCPSGQTLPPSPPTLYRSVPKAKYFRSSPCPVEGVYTEYPHEHTHPTLGSLHCCPCLLTA